MLGLEIGVSIEQAVARLTDSGLKIGGIVRDVSGSFVDLEDPDGNPIYLWEVTQTVPESELAHSTCLT